jgi:hypothetical protein
MRAGPLTWAGPHLASMRGGQLTWRLTVAEEPLKFDDPA